MSYWKYSRLNEAENSLRSLSLFLTLLLTPNYSLGVFASFMAYVVFCTSIALKLSFTSAGILQLILLLNSDSNSVFEFFGIDSVAIWKFRAFHLGIALMAVFGCLVNHLLPIFYYRLIRVSVPDDTWIVSLSSNSLVFVSFNLICLCKCAKFSTIGN